MNETPAKEPLLQVRDLVKDYKNGPETIRILKDVNLDVMPGEMIAIMGPSGMGKSTFLFILGLLHPPTSGSYWVLGEDVLKRDRSSQAAFRRNFAGFVFQSCNLFEHLRLYTSSC